MKVSLENLDIHHKDGGAALTINSPRSVEALRRQGVLPKELAYVSKDEYRKMFAAEKLDEYNLGLRVDHLEKKRLDKYRQCVEERVKLVEMEKAGLNIYGAGSGRGAGSRDVGGTAGLLSKEAQMIEKIKKNQRKEVEQMMQYELEMQAMRQKNEEKARLQMEKEHKRQLEISEKRKEAEAKKLRYEEDKKRKAEEEEAARKKAEQDDYMKQKLKEEEAKQLAKQKLKEARDKEEEQKKKQAEFKASTEKILEQQRHEVLRKKQEMETLEQERKRKLEEEVEAKKRQAKEKQEQHEAKIKESKQRSELTALEKKKLYDEKERAAEEKKRKYEDKKEEMKKANEAKFQKKEELIERAKSANANTLAKRKEEYYDQQRKNEERRKEKDREQQALLEAHLREEKEKERKREEAKKSNMNQLEERKVTLIKSAEEKEHKIKSVAERKDAERMLKNNLDHMKKMDKLENVRRKERQKEWERNNLWNKILDENEKIEGMKKEKKNLLQEKAEVKAKIDRDKEELAKKFQLVKEGKLDPKNLFQGQGEVAAQEGSVRSNRGTSMQVARHKDKSLAGSASQTAQQTKIGFTTEAAEGVNSAPMPAGRSETKLPPAARKTTQNRVRGASPGKERPKFEAKPGEALETATLRLKDVQGREMLKVLEEENKAEHNRESELLLVSDLQERKRLQKIHAVQKAKAKERISKMMARHEEEMDELKTKLK